MSLRQQILRAAQGSALLRIFYIITTLAGSVVLARALGPHGYGVYAFAFAVANILALPSEAGVPTLLVRETANSKARADWGAMKGLWVWATKIITLTSVAIGATAALAVSLQAAHIEKEMRGALLIALLLIPLNAFGAARAAALRGLGCIVRGQLPESVIRPGLLVLLVSAAWSIKDDLTPSDVMAWTVVAAGIAFASGAMVLWRSRPPEVVRAQANADSSGYWRKAVMPLALLTSMQVVSAQAGVVLLGLFRSGDEVGLYKVAASASAVSLFGLQTVNLVIAPYIARLHALGDRCKLQRLVGGGALAAFAVTLAIFLVVVLLGKELILLLYGDEYLEAWLPLVVLCGGQVLNAGFGSVDMLLSMTGHERESARWFAIAAFANIALGIALIPVIGMLGAAVASVIFVVIWNLAFRRIALEKVKVDGSIAYYLRRTGRGNG